jgi:histidinol-phosphate aminotransferase
LLTEFSKIDCIKKVFPSDANFILLRVEDADQFYQRAMDVKLLVRNVSYQPTLENCIRVTVGSRDQNNLLIKAIR